MDQILDRLYLGDFEDAERLTLAQCSCVMTLCERKPILTSSAIAHIHAPIPDEVYLPTEAWGELVHALQVAVRDEDAVLVHCRLGKSRAPTLVCGFLAVCGWRLESALALAISMRSIIAPHSETWRGMVEWYQK